MTDRSYEPLNPEVTRISDGFAVRQGDELIAVCCSEDTARGVVALPELLEAMQTILDDFEAWSESMLLGAHTGVDPCPEQETGCGSNLHDLMMGFYGIANEVIAKAKGETP